MATVSTERIKAKDLKPGDLFSTIGPLYWKTALDMGGCGERVYIRTNAPAGAFPDSEDFVYRITITTEKDNGNR